MLKKVPVLILLLFALIRQASEAQINDEIWKYRPKNSVYLTLGGDASSFSISYDRLFRISKSILASGRIGIGIANFLFFDVSIPHHVTCLLGNKRNFFEFGIGGTYTENYLNTFYFLYPILGYRLQPLTYGNICFRIYLGVPVNKEKREDAHFIPIGLSFGLSFR